MFFNYIKGLKKKQKTPGNSQGPLSPHKERQKDLIVVVQV